MITTTLAPEQIASLVLKHTGHETTLRHTRSAPSAVTTAWGVAWDEAAVARDIMQNFFDANRHRLDAVEVQAQRKNVVISAPAEFDLEHLFYLGSEKGDEDVGQYGEGFKAAAMCLLRDYSVSPLALSGHDAVRIRISDETVGSSNIRPLVYDYYRMDRPLLGSSLILPGCPPNLIRELKGGLTHFLYPENPLLKKLLWQSGNGKFEIYHTTGPDGYVFYRNLRRGTIENVPFAFVINQQYAKIEKEIAKDRDRTAFGEKLLNLFYSTFFQRIYGLDTPSVLTILRATEEHWTRGHALLSHLAGVAHGLQNKAPREVEALFGDRYYAVSHAHDTNTMITYRQIEDSWVHKGRTKLPAYFHSFGVVSARAEIQKVTERAKEEQRKKARPATPAEANALAVLQAVLDQTAPEISTGLKFATLSYTVAETRALIGMLKEGQPYRHRNVFLTTNLFTSSFGEAVAVFLHEHAHIFGYDGSRGFTDALTRLIETTITQRHNLDPLEAQWKECVARVRAERNGTIDSASVDRALAALTHEEALAALRRLPAHLLQDALHPASDDPDASEGSDDEEWDEDDWENEDDDDGEWDDDWDEWDEDDETVGAQEYVVNVRPAILEPNAIDPQN